MKDHNETSDLMEPSSLRFANRLYLLASIFVGGMLVAFAFDFQMARAFHADGLPNDLRKVLELSEAFAHGFGVFVILLAVGLLDQTNRWRYVQLLIAVWAAGILALLSKQILGRLRPYNFETTSFPESIWETFGPWFPLLTNGTTGSHIQSFPSAHTAQAVGLAIGLTWLYPRAWWLFATLAVLAALQRIDAKAHFLSDTFAGAAFACVITAIFLDRRILGRFFRQAPKGG